jgi:AcrR family transcriptional regulator
MPGRKAPEIVRREQILQAALRVAIRRRLSGLTIREVASEARLSSGLVLFHFRTRDGLISALLGWLLDKTSVLRPAAMERSERPALDCLVALVRAEAARMATDRARSELFFEYWVLGSRMKELRRQMRRALIRYRQEFRALADEVFSSAPGRPEVRAESVASAAVSFVYGCAIQAVIGPKHFDVDGPLKILDLWTSVGPEKSSAPAPNRRPKARKLP